MAVDALAEIMLDAAERLGAALTPRQVQQICAYTDLVTKWQRIANLTAADSPARFVREHIVDCLSARPFVNGPRVIDVGTGAGLPGLVLAIALPQLVFYLLEARGKRARFLTQVQIELGLSNVEIIRERVEEHIPIESYDTVIARAFGSFSHLISATKHLQRPSSRLVAMKGTVDPQEIDGCDLASHRFKIVALDVPGFSDRNLIIVDFSA